MHLRRTVWGRVKPVSKRCSDKKATVITPTSISPNPQIVEYDYFQFGCINKININGHINYAFFVPPLAYINSH
jgi:hypothetical protein